MENIATIVNVIAVTDLLSPYRPVNLILLVAYYLEHHSGDFYCLIFFKTFLPWDIRYQRLRKLKKIYLYNEMYWKYAYCIDYFPDMYVKKVVAKALYMQIDDW